MPQESIKRNFQVWPKTKLSSVQSTVGHGVAMMMVVTVMMIWRGSDDVGDGSDVDGGNSLSMLWGLCSISSFKGWNICSLKVMTDIFTLKFVMFSGIFLKIGILRQVPYFGAVENLHNVTCYFTGDWHKIFVRCGIHFFSKFFLLILVKWQKIFWCASLYIEEKKQITAALNRRPSIRRLWWYVW